MDEADRAALLEQRERQYAIDRHNQRNRPALPAGPRDCAECGEPIPPRRLAAVPDALRCIDCEEIHDHMRARYAR